MNLLFLVAMPLFVLGLSAAIVGAQPLDDQSIRFRDMNVEIDGQVLSIEPLTIVTTKAQGQLPAGTPSWQGPYRLPRVAWVFRSLTPGSIKVRSADGQELVEGVDYLLDSDWAALASAAGSKHPPETPLDFEYQYSLSRLDLIERTPAGKLQVIKGKEDMTTPLLPKPSPGSTPVAGVYLPHNTRALSPGNIKLIDPDYDGIPPLMNGEQLAGIRQRLASDEPTVIVFFGDSITAMGQKDLGEQGNYVDRFARWLGERYPERQVISTGRADPIVPAEKQVVVVKSGVGGNTSRMGLSRMAKDVIDHKPNLVVIMFGVNDENSAGKGQANSVSLPEYRSNLEQMVKNVRDAGATPLVMTTSMKNLDWTHTAGNLDEYAAVAREVARDQNVALVDAFAAWEALPRTGYDYMILLGSCINHPVGLGHDLFAEGLRAAIAAP